jgi:hypothetical protein
MTSRTTYGGKCFPNRFDVMIDIEQAQFYGAYDLPGSDDPRVINGSRAKVCFVTVERVGIRGTPTASVEAKLRKIIAADRETWNTGEYNFVAFVWEAMTCKGEPAGFKVFDIRPKRNSRGEISEVTFDARLLYIRVAPGSGCGAAALRCDCDVARSMPALLAARRQARDSRCV